MTITARILADSISPTGSRLTTYELKYPKFIHGEFMTHRVLSRNAASSRAIPVEKMIQAVLDDPAMPVFWGKNQKGMQAAEELSDEPTEYEGEPLESPRQQAKDVWLQWRDTAVEGVRVLQGIGLHKQIANRMLEPWAHITVIASGTEWQNLFHLRTHKMAQPEFQALAKLMKQAYDESQPSRLSSGDWHMPLIHKEDRPIARKLAGDLFTHEPHALQIDYVSNDILKKVSVGRCARVSYLTHDGKRDLLEDIALHDRLLAGTKTGEPLHMSPFEHVAMAVDDVHDDGVSGGNFGSGWVQYRKTIEGEAGPQEPTW